jgi:hypothetical protein
MQITTIGLDIAKNVAQPPPVRCLAQLSAASACLRGDAHAKSPFNQPRRKLLRERRWAHMLRMRSPPPDWPGIFTLRQRDGMLLAFAPPTDPASPPREIELVLPASWRRSDQPPLGATVIPFFMARRRLRDLPARSSG